MRILSHVTPSKEQLPILTETNSGILLIRGAAGSGKTTTALMRLKHLTSYWVRRNARLGSTDPVRVLVLTYNKTLRGYIEALATDQVDAGSSVHMEVHTFAKWAMDLIGHPDILPDGLRHTTIERLAAPLGFDERFIDDEVDYLLGRFEPANLDEYETIRRDGRGTTPRMERATRRRLLDEVVTPYQEFKKQSKLKDWNDVAVEAISAPGKPWDVVIVDEAQDFSANQVRAVLAHLAVDYSATFVLDAVQRIYPRSFTWKEVGATLSAIRQLQENYRNTKQVAAFARSLVAGLTVEDDGTLPDFHAATHTGPKPVVASGRFNKQMAYVIKNVIAPALAADESVAILQPLGKGWSATVKQRLNEADIDWVEITKKSEWPTGPELVAISTLHSAKGLEFDHVIIPGLNQEVTPHGAGDGDSQLEALRRLVAMGVGRARKSVTVTYKEDEASSLIGLLDPSTFDKVVL